MSENSPIKDALYSEIDSVGQDKIDEYLLKKQFSSIFSSVFERVLEKINKDKISDETIGLLAESITHYLFTEMLIPSQRKVVFENIELDLVIPNTLGLKRDSDNSKVVLFVKDPNTIQDKISQIKKIQKNDDNIWVISKDPLDISQRNYITNEKSFAKFLMDSQNFVQTKNMNKLNIFKTKM